MRDEQSREFLSHESKGKIDLLPPLNELREFREKYLQTSINRNQIDEEDFYDVYSEEDIDADKQRVREVVDQFETAKAMEPSQDVRENSEKLEIMGKLFEVLCSDDSVLSRALNVPKGEVVAQMSSDFDDIFRKVDLFIEFPKNKTDIAEPSDYAIGVDVTISATGYIDKLNNFKSYYEEYRNAPDIKYFVESVRGHNQQRPLARGACQLPKFIINTPPKHLVEIISQWGKWCEAKNQLNNEKSKQSYLRDLGILDNPIWYQIIRQMRRQAEVLVKYFEHSHLHLSSMYTKALQTLVRSEKAVLDGYINRDRLLVDKIVEINMEKDPNNKMTRLGYLYQNKYRELMSNEAIITINKFKKVFQR